MLEMLLEKKLRYSMMNNFQEGLFHFVARFSSPQFMDLFRRKADLSDLDTEQRSICSVRLWEKSYLGMTPFERAKWRRDHQEEWALECGTSPDRDPAAWFAALTSLIESIKAAQELKARTRSTMVNKVDAGTNVIKDHYMHSRVPGAYPQE